MLDAISYSLMQVQQKIPAAVLNQTFIASMKHRTHLPVSVQSRITDLIINKKVLVDLNIIGGETAIIPLDSCELLEQESTYSVYRIPKSATANRSVSSVHEVRVGAGIGVDNSAVLGSASMIGEAASNMMRSISPVPTTSFGNAVLISENTFMIEMPPNFGQFGGVQVSLEYDPTLSGIKPRTVFNFAKLVVLATKAFIYNSQFVPMDQAQIKSGSAFGSYKDAVDSYSDADELYDEYLLTTWATVDKLNDSHTRQRLISLAVGRAI